VKRRKRDGILVVTLPEQVARLLGTVMRDLGDVIASPPPGGVAERLYPHAYSDPTEEEAERDWQAAVHDDLAGGRRAAVAALLADLASARSASQGAVEVELDAEGETRWLTVLNDARLALGTALGVSEDEELEVPEDDPRATSVIVYAVLTELQGALVDVLLDELPEAGAGDAPSF
jgi:hypothetical protein